MSAGNVLRRARQLERERGRDYAVSYLRGALQVLKQGSATAITARRLVREWSSAQ